MVFKKSVLVLLAAIVGLTWVQAFPEQRDAFIKPRHFSDAITHDDNDLESLRATTQRGLFEVTSTHSPRKFKIRLTPEASLKIIRNIYKANDEAKDKWGTLSPMEKSHVLNMRQTLCNVVSGVDMPLDVQDIQNVQNVICSPLFSNNEEAMSL